MSKVEEVPIVWGKDDGIHYITGTYKKDIPNKDIGCAINDRLKKASNK